MRLLAGEIDRQALLDRLQGILEGSEGWRIVLSDTAAVEPHTETEKEREEASRAAREEAAVSASREEVYQSVVSGAALGPDYAVLVALSTVVAGIGLAKDSVAVVIGGMLIAPILGPILALAFGTAVGDRSLVTRALRTAAAGLAVAVALSLALPLAFSADPGAGELGARTAVDFGSVGLALASGAAAALSITSGVPAVLVGVMVAVALLPPAAAIGICVALAAWPEAVGAAHLLGVNLVSVTLAAILTFLGKGVRPRTWLEREGAAQSVRVTVTTLAAALLVLTGLIALDRFGPL
jgi:uncharacterized hydrophobic protein (TIGR00341 family)